MIDEKERKPGEAYWCTSCDEICVEHGKHCEHMTLPPDHEICIGLAAALDAADEQDDDVSSDYPIGGMVEPYDIEREKEMTDEAA